jgi:hypothetical protein
VSACAPNDTEAGRHLLGVLYVLPSVCLPGTCGRLFVREFACPAQYRECRIGQLAPETIWKDLVEGLPKGLPAADDKGLDHTPTWGRTYWGGALFCLLADIEIHKRTANQHGLRDALRGILAAGGSMQEQWPLTRALEAGDQATGVPVLTELYTRMKDAPVNVNLDELWQQLGVEVREGKVVFHDDAPLAAVRNAITQSAQKNKE